MSVAAIHVRQFDDGKEFLSAATEFLELRPVQHNLVLTIVHGAIVHGDAGRYWLAAREGQASGAVIQAPLDRWAVVTPMKTEVAVVLVDAIVEAGVGLPGVNGEAATAAAFAGHWTERTGTGATPGSGLRLYELGELRPPKEAAGSLRRAVREELELLSCWVRDFQVEAKTGVQVTLEKARSMAEKWVRSGQLWIWEDGAPRAMVVTRQPMNGVVRLGSVFTPAEHRRKGYASACVYGVSGEMIGYGLRPILYTDLANPRSNSIYRNLGYRAVAEGIHYLFHDGR
jgi:uncharacterized protein